MATKSKYMEIRDPVHGTILLSSLEVKTIDTPEFQRLRSIKQLGFGEFGFPGAVHTRFLHSLGVCHLAGMVFDNVFKDFSLFTSSEKERIRTTFKLAALLHDVGHGPLSHSTEQVMPDLVALNIKCYDGHQTKDTKINNLRATHEDYTIKFITESPLSEIIQQYCCDIKPVHVACLIDINIVCPDDFFIFKGVDVRPILNQIISSELDVDRMDYLERDSYFCGTNYGKIDLFWLIKNLSFHIVSDKVYLALKRKALYTFDDFLISRHHMRLMVYYHHKSIIYDEMLYQYLVSKECSFLLPNDLASYTKCTDNALYEHLASIDNLWAQRIVSGKPFRMLSESHTTEHSQQVERLKQALLQAGINILFVSSATKLSTYDRADKQTLPLYVIDDHARMAQAELIEQSTGIFQKYAETRLINRIYVAPEQYKLARNFLGTQV